MTHYERLIESIKKGGLPSLTGINLTPAQANEIRWLLNIRKIEIDDYYKYCIATRIVKHRPA
jgi:hypothetical protein